MLAEIKQTVGEAEVADELEASARNGAALKHGQEVGVGRRHEMGDGDVGPRAGG